MSFANYLAKLETFRRGVSMCQKLRMSLRIGVFFSLLVGHVSANSPFAVISESVHSENALVAGSYGHAEMDGIGDYDLDGIEDVVIGVPTANNMQGGIDLELLNSDGSLKQQIIFDRETFSNTDKALFNSVNGVGSGLTVIQQFSAAQNCAKIIVSSNPAVSPNFLYVVELCRNNAIQVLSRLDTTHVALSGTGIKSSNFGASLACLNRNNDPENALIAVGAPMAMGVSGSNAGQVYLLNYNKVTRAWSRETIVSDTSLSLSGLLVSGGEFGSKVRSIDNNIYSTEFKFAVLSKYGEGYSGIPGSIFLLSTIRNDPFSTSFLKKWTAQSFPSLQSKSIPYMSDDFAAADMNHDGLYDILIGNKYLSGGDNENEGVVLLGLRDNYNVLTEEIEIKKGSQGFVGAKIESDDYGLGTQILAIDINHDNMQDIVLAAPKSASRSGSLWGLIMKSAPWLKQSINEFLLEADGKIAIIRLSDYFGGHLLKYTLSQQSSDICVVTAPGDLVCSSKTRVNLPDFKIIATDTDNWPETVYYSDTLSFPLRAVGGNNSPVSLLVDTLFYENVTASEIIVDLSKYFIDEDANTLLYSIGQVNPVMTASITDQKLNLVINEADSGVVRVLLNVYDGAGGVVNDTLVVSFHRSSKVIIGEGKPQNNTVLIHYGVHNYSTTDFSGSYELRCYLGNGALLWKHKGWKSYQEPILINMPLLPKQAVLVIESSNYEHAIRVDK